MVSESCGPGKDLSRGRCPGQQKSLVQKLKTNSESPVQCKKVIIHRYLILHFPKQILLNLSSSSSERMNV